MSMFHTTPGLELKDVPGSLPKGDNVPQDVDVAIVGQHVERMLSDLTASCFVEDAVWRDSMGMLTTVRVIAGSENIARLWKERNVVRQSAKVQILPGGMPVKLLPDSAWVAIPFTFFTQQGESLVGVVSGSASLILQDGEWRIWQLITILEQFIGHPSPDALVPVLGSQEEKKSAEAANTNIDYDVAIIGAGQSGLSLAGRLGAVGVKYVLFERNQTIGENWTSRYDTVVQHTTKANNHLPGDPTWTAEDPDFLTAKDAARGFQGYVKKYGINLQLATALKNAAWDEQKKIWTLTLQTSDKADAFSCSCRHLVLAMGASYVKPKYPDLDNRDSFTGTIMHSSEFKNGKNWTGKKAVVIGAGVSAHDVAQDLTNNKLSSVTMIQRSPTAVVTLAWTKRILDVFYNDFIPITIADRMGAGPLKIIAEITRGIILQEASQDPEYWDSLEKAGLMVDRDANLFNSIFVTMRSFWIDVGSSAHITNGDIKLVSKVEPKSFTERGIRLNDGRELDADLVVFGTGFVKDYREYAAKYIDPNLLKECAEQFGLDEGGELRGLYDPVRENLWSLGGGAQQARWNSRFIALKLQADQLGIALN